MAINNNKVVLLRKFGIAFHLIIAALLIFAGLVKSVYPVQFAFKLRYDYSFAILPAILFAVLLPFIEIALGISMLSAKFAWYGIQGMRILFVTFAAFHGWRYFIEKAHLESCSCFGSLFRLSETDSMLLAVILLIFSFLFGVSRTEKTFQFGQLLATIRKGLKKIPGLMIATLLLLILSARYLYIQRYLQAELRSIDAHGNARRNLEIVLRQNLSERLNFFRPNAVIFVRSPGCTSCKAELKYWSDSRYANLVSFLGVIPESASPGIENLAKQLKLKYSIMVIPDHAFNAIMGKYNYIGRIIISTDGKVLFANDNQYGQASKMAFINFLEHCIRSSDSFK